MYNDSATAAMSTVPNFALPSNIHENIRNIIARARLEDERPTGGARSFGCLQRRTAQVQRKHRLLVWIHAAPVMAPEPAQRGLAAETSRGGKPERVQ